LVQILAILPAILTGGYCDFLSLVRQVSVQNIQIYMAYAVEAAPLNNIRINQSINEDILD